MTDRPITIPAIRIPALREGRMTQMRVPLKRLPLHKPQPHSITYLEGKMICRWQSGVRHDLPSPYSTGDRLFPAMPIPSLNANYCADTHGRIWSRAADGKTWRVLAGSKTNKGYLSVTPAHDGKYKTRLVHRLVAEAFYGFEPNGLKQVRHLNSDPEDNSPENLDWGTQEDNWSDRLANGKALGESHHASKLTEEDVRYIRASEKPHRELARHFGVRQATIWSVRNSVTWRENPAPKPPNQPRWASRTTLVVNYVRVHRVQEISEAGVIAEGGPPSHPSIDRISREFGYTDFSQSWFAQTWNATHGPDAWDRNDWVCAISFDVHLCNIDQMPGDV